MFQPFKRNLKTLKNITLLQGAHLLAKGFLQLRGYRWEIRRNGEVSLGFWRKSFRTKSKRSSYPKRFVLVPGFGDSALSWTFVLGLLQPLLKLNFDEVILFDFPGFGGFLSSEKAFPSFDLMMSALDDALDSLKPHTILGHSLGGWLAAHYAGFCGSGARPRSNRRNYSGPKTLLLANPSGLFGEDAVKQEWITRFTAVMQTGFPALRPHLFAKEPAWFPWISPAFSRFIVREDILQFMESVREEHALDQLAKDIQAQVWLLWGEKDTLIPSSCARAWLRSLDSAHSECHRAVVIHGVGHSIHVESPAITAAVIGQILSNRIPHRMGKRWWTVLEA